jgi:flagellar hook assembly protein FlgD
MAYPNSNEYQLTTTELPEIQKAYIRFNIQAAAHVIVKVTDMNDNEVRLLVNEILQQGKHSVLFNYGTLANGQYHIKLIINTEETVEIKQNTIKIEHNEN